MIDPHVHLRDWNEAGKETLRHGLEVARRAGLDAVFEMPNTDPPLTSRRALDRRIQSADAVLREVSGVVHGMYAGLTADPDQVREVAAAHGELYPRVVGLKLFAGHSTGGMGVIGEEEQRRVYRTLVEAGYRGLLAVHAEKEGFLRKRADGSPDWDPRHPGTHALARPPEAEVKSVEDQIRFAAEEGFRGTLHVSHVSVPESLAVVREARTRGLPFRITTGVTPHHALLAAEDMERPGGLLLKTNPPLRPRSMQRAMLQAVLRGEVDWIETDHAPHALGDKTERYASGIPGLPFHPRFVSRLRSLGMPEAALDRLTHRAIEEAFGFQIPPGGCVPEVDLAPEYPFDPYGSLAPIVSIIVAMDGEGLIGSGGGLPWRVPEDLRRFRRATMGHSLVMGRRTFEGLPASLDGRHLVVMSRKADFRPPGVAVARSVAEALRLSSGDEVFVAGGAKVYAAFLPLADSLRVTLVRGEHRGDTHFPAVDWSEWTLVEETPGEDPSAPAVLFRRYLRARPSLAERA